jgi:hypothetical protein
MYFLSRTMSSLSSKMALVVVSKIRKSLRVKETVF